jgi:hypothetical protein
VKNAFKGAPFEAAANDFILGSEDGREDVKEFYVIWRGIAMYYIRREHLVIDRRAFRNGHAQNMNVLPILENLNLQPVTFEDKFERINGKDYRIFDGDIYVEKAVTDYIAAPDLLTFYKNDNRAIVGVNANNDIEFYALPLRK